MNKQQVREIAEVAFKSRFGDIGIVGINVEPRFVRIIYDAAFEDLRTEGTMRVRSKFVEKVWRAWKTAPDTLHPLHRQVRPCRGLGPRRSGAVG